MSSSVVRTWFREKIVSLLPIGIEYVEVVNTPVELAEKDPPFIALEFQSINKERVSLGNPGCFRERGFVDVDFCGKANIGDIETLELSEEIASELEKVREVIPAAGNVLRLRNVQPPDTAKSEDGRFFVCKIVVDYELDGYH